VGLGAEPGNGPEERGGRREEQEAARLLHSYVSLMVEPDNQTDIKHRLLTTPLGRSYGDANKQCPLL
jgi:hypothetical protein